MDNIKFNTNTNGIINISPNNTTNVNSINKQLSKIETNLPFTTDKLFNNYIEEMTLEEDTFYNTTEKVEDDTKYVYNKKGKLIKMIKNSKIVYEEYPSGKVKVQYISGWKFEFNEDGTIKQLMDNNSYLWGNKSLYKRDDNGDIIIYDKDDDTKEYLKLTKDGNKIELYSKEKEYQETCEYVNYLFDLYKKFYGEEYFNNESKLVNNTNLTCKTFKYKNIDLQVQYDTKGRIQFIHFPNGQELEYNFNNETDNLYVYLKKEKLYNGIIKEYNSNGMLTSVRTDNDTIIYKNNWSIHLDSNNLVKKIDNVNFDFRNNCKYRIDGKNIIIYNAENGTNYLKLTNNGTVSTINDNINSDWIEKSETFSDSNNSLNLNQSNDENLDLEEKLFRRFISNKKLSLNYNINNIIKKDCTMNEYYKKILNNRPNNKNEKTTENISELNERYNNSIEILDKYNITLDKNKVVYYEFENNKNIVYLDNNIVLKYDNNNLIINDYNDDIEYQYTSKNGKGNLNIEKVKLDYNHNDLLEIDYTGQNAVLKDLTFEDDKEQIIATFNNNKKIDNLDFFVNEDNIKCLYLSNGYILQFKDNKIEVLDRIEQIKEIAMKEINQKGKKYRDWYYGYDQSTHWCAVFISWLYSQLRGNQQFFEYDEENKFKGYDGAGDIPRYSVDNEGEKYGDWFESELDDPTTKPQAGDIILFNDSDKPEYADKYFSGHIGYVYKVDDEKVYTIEGNTSEENEAYPGCDLSYVAIHEYDRNSPKINGYYRPYYDK